VPENTVQIIISGNLFEDLASVERFAADFVAAIKEDINDRDVIIDNRPPTKIAIDPFRDLGPRNI